MAHLAGVNKGQVLCNSIRYALRSAKEVLASSLLPFNRSLVQHASVAIGHSRANVSMVSLANGA